MHHEVSKTLDEFQKMKYNEPEKWDELKQEYRIVNQYNVVEGVVPPKKILELHEKNGI